MPYSAGDTPIFTSWSGSPPDPLRYPALYDTILARRVLAYVVDLALLAFLCTGTAIVIGILGILTFGLLWPSLPLVILAVVIVYDTASVGGPQAATPGMRFFGITLRRWDGVSPSYTQAALHSAAFYLGIALTSWLILLVAPFNRRRRCIHDMVCGFVAVNRAALDDAGGDITAQR